MISRFFRRRRPVGGPPIFIRGMSRSGGTLTVTVLDAHEDISMSYELYPDLLSKKGKGGTPARSAEFGVAGIEETPGSITIDQLNEVLSSSNSEKVVLATLKDMGLADVRVFLARVGRSDIPISAMRRIGREHAKAGYGLDTGEDRLRLIERVCVEKMEREKGCRWGLKCTGQYDAYLKLWPDAKFINMVRDGRDVLASQLNTGNFNPSPENVASSWSETHRRFRTLVDRDDVAALEVIYERLAQDPESEVRRICNFLDVEYSPSMLEFNKKDLSIFKAPKGHLSISRISKPIDTSTIGRWKTDLNADHLAAFTSIAGEDLERYGYLET